MDFQNSPLEILKVFQYFNFETDFLEKENLIQNIEYSFLVETTMI